MAERHTSLCQLELYSVNVPVGQVWSVSGSSTLDMIKVINSAWFTSERRYTYSNNTCSSSGACSNYTQVSITLNNVVGFCHYKWSKINILYGRQEYLIDIVTLLFESEQYSKTSHSGNIILLCSTEFTFVRVTL